MVDIVNAAVRFCTFMRHKMPLKERNKQGSCCIRIATLKKHCGSLLIAILLIINSAFLS